MRYDERAPQGAKPKIAKKSVESRARRESRLTGDNGVIGIDEVGRGCWAGPLLVVAARQTRRLPSGLTDSKLLTRTERKNFIHEIKKTCQLGEGWVEASEIDYLGLSEAMRLAVKRALSDLKARPSDEIIMDGPINYCANSFTNVRCVVKADSLHPIVSAASIYAKVLRDSKMISFAEKFPQYNFEKHVGYGTKAHRKALLEHGVCILHRKTYRPIQALL